MSCGEPASMFATRRAGLSRFLRRSTRTTIVAPWWKEYHGKLAMMGENNIVFFYPEAPKIYRRFMSIGDIQSEALQEEKEALELMKSGKLELAKYRLAKLCKKYPHHAKFHFNHALVLYKLKQYNDSLDEVVKSWSPKGYENLANQGDWEKSGR